MIFLDKSRSQILKTKIEQIKIENTVTLNFKYNTTGCRKFCYLHGHYAKMDKSNLNHYDLLGVKRDAAVAEIRSAFRQKALEAHPDKGGNTMLFQQIMKAFDTLADASQRKSYDKQLQTSAGALHPAKLQRRVFPPSMHRSGDFLSARIEGDIHARDAKAPKPGSLASMVFRAEKSKGKDKLYSPRPSPRPSPRFGPASSPFLAPCGVSPFASPVLGPIDPSQEHLLEPELRDAHRRHQKRSERKRIDEATTDNLLEALRHIFQGLTPEERAVRLPQLQPRSKEALLEYMREYKANEKKREEEEAARVLAGVVAEISPAVDESARISEANLRSLVDLSSDEDDFDGSECFDSRATSMADSEEFDSNIITIDDDDDAGDEKHDNSSGFLSNWQALDDDCDIAEIGCGGMSTSASSGSPREKSISPSNSASSHNGTAKAESSTVNPQGTKRRRNSTSSRPASRRNSTCSLLGKSNGDSGAANLCPLGMSKHAGGYVAKMFALCIEFTSVKAATIEDGLGLHMCMADIKQRWLDDVFKNGLNPLAFDKLCDDVCAEHGLLKQNVMHRGRVRFNRSPTFASKYESKLDEVVRLRLGIEEAMNHDIDHFKEFVKANSDKFTPQTYSRVLEITKVRKFTGLMGVGMFKGSTTANCSPDQIASRTARRNEKRAEKEKVRAQKKEAAAAGKAVKKLDRIDKRLDQLLQKAEKRKAHEQEQQRKRKKDEKWQRYKWYMSKDRTMEEILAMRQREQEEAKLAEEASASSTNGAKK